MTEKRYKRVIDTSAISSLQGIFMLLFKLPPLPKPPSFRPSNPPSFSSRRLSLSSEPKRFDFDFDFDFFVVVDFVYFLLGSQESARSMKLEESEIIQIRSNDNNCTRKFNFFFQILFFLFFLPSVFLAIKQIFKSNLKALKIFFFNLLELKKKKNHLDHMKVKVVVDELN